MISPYYQQTLSSYSELPNNDQNFAISLYLIELL